MLFVVDLSQAVASVLSSVDEGGGLQSDNARESDNIDKQNKTERRMRQFKSKPPSLPFPHIYGLGKKIWGRQSNEVRILETIIPCRMIARMMETIVFQSHPNAQSEKRR
jgi:hypothetical protein